MKKLICCFLLLWVILPSNGNTQEEYRAYSRLDYYTSEPTAEIVVEVPDDRSGKRIYFDLVFEQQILVRTYPGMPGRSNTVPFPAQKLQEGDNEITVSFYENEQWMDSRKVRVILRKDRLGAVKTDRLTGALIKHGLPMIPVITESGSAFCGEEVLEELKDAGFNTVIAGWHYERRNPKRRLAWLDLCAKYDLQVVYNLGPILEEYFTPEKALELLIGEVRSVANHPAILAYLLPSEISPLERMQMFYNALKETDPYHPVTLSVIPGRMEDAILEAADILHVGLLQEKRFLDLEEFYASFMEEYGYQKPVWFSINNEEEALDVSLALCSGAAGIAARKVTAQQWPDRINEILPQRLAGNPVRVTAMDENITAAGWSGRGGMAIVTCNNGEDEQDITLHAEEMTGDFPVEIIGTGESLETRNGVINDRLAPGEDKYYRIIQKEDIHFRDSQRKKNLVADPGFEERDDDLCDLCFIETRLVKEGMHAMDILVKEKNEPVIIELALNDMPSDTLYLLTVWARLKPSAANYYLRKSWFGKREWQGERKEAAIFTMGVSSDRQSTFELTSSWEKYEMTIDLRSMDTSDLRPFIKIHKPGEYLFDEIKFIPAGP